ncbi:MAG TPA: CheR family methyltransferase [Casimicrobiaceae bacterium]|jgi:two-component system CheB/CheR fusion protein
MPSERNADFEALLQYLKASRGFDFTGYKRSTLTRRVMKRMAALKDVKTFGAYQVYLEVHPEELPLLFNTILINVTAFFRDAAAWNFLAEKIIPRIVKGKRPSDPIRVCSVGCASGEEAYSIAILFAEALGEKAFRERVKIYATDVDGDALAQARHGAYNGKSVAAVPEKLRAKYFENAGVDRFIVKPDLRRSVIFGRLDLLQDAPISRLDLLICRNTLMYFDAETQARIVGRFHFALNESGLIFLGKSEMLLSHSDLFSTVNLEHRFFSKTSDVRLRERLLPLQPVGDNTSGRAFATEIRMRELAFDAVPVSQLVVDRHGRVVLVSAVARAMFGIASGDLGKPLQDLEISFRPIELRSLIQQAYSERGPVAITQVKRVKADGTTQYFDVQVTPLREQDKHPAGATVSFVDVTRGHELQTALHRTNQDLETANEELQSANEELETTNEELQSTNEELETTNEELQSTNEELETMNEELQATNEELETTNDELQLRTDELNHANAFMHAVLSSLKMGVAIINSRFEVIAWNETAEHMWGTRAKEAQGHSVFSLGIGLPLDKVGTEIRACLNGKKDDEEQVLQAVNRRGKSIQCRVTCKSFVGPDEKRGVTLIMEEVR